MRQHRVLVLVELGGLAEEAQQRLLGELAVLVLAGVDEAGHDLLELGVLEAAHGVGAAVAGAGLVVVAEAAAVAADAARRLGALPASERDEVRHEARALALRLAQPQLEAQVDELHEKFLVELKRIFEKHRGLVDGWERRELRIL